MYGKIRQKAILSGQIQHIPEQGVYTMSTSTQPGFTVSSVKTVADLLTFVDREICMVLGWNSVRVSFRLSLTRI